MSCPGLDLDCDGFRYCATCPTEWCEIHNELEDATICPDLGHLCPTCSDGHTSNCSTCRGIAREDHDADMADAMRKGEL